MKYSLVLAALSAAAIATPFVHVEVTEDAVVGDSNGHRHHETRHHDHHRGRSHSRNRHHGNWLSNLWSGNNGRNHSRNGRDHSRNGRDHSRNGRNDRSHSRGRRGNNGRRDRSGSRGRFHTENMMDDIFGQHYECILDGRTNSDEKRDTKRCCEENGGELYKKQGHCVFRDVLRNPRDEWRDCAMEQRGAEFAECYYREAREIDDELDGSDRNRHNHRNDRNRRNHRNHRDNGEDDRDDDEESHHRHRHHNEEDDREDEDSHNRHRHHNDHRRHRYDDDEQTVLSGGNHGKNRRHERYECRVELHEDQDRREEITRNCCENEAEGKFDKFDRTCIVSQNDNRDRFMQCAQEQGAEDSECRRE